MQALLPAGSSGDRPAIATRDRRQFGSGSGRDFDGRTSSTSLSQGMLKVRTTTLNQNGETVQIFVGNLVVPRRPV